MKIHNIKLHEQFCDPVAMGTKPFEVRRNDRGYQAGDYIRFTSIDDVLNKVHHPIDKEIFKITYVLSGWGIEDGFVVLGIKKLEDRRELALINGIHKYVNIDETKTAPDKGGN